MIHDMTIAAECDTLQEYYQKVYDLQAEAHQPDYMLVHEEIKKCLQDCESYTELGVNQGGTLAIPMLANMKTVKGYDINPEHYLPSESLFKEYAEEHDIDFATYKADTLKCTLDPVDLLYIDTVHVYEHLTKELALHGHKAKKYIIFHDTVTGRNLKKAVQEYVQKNKEWSIITDCLDNVGFMTIKRA